MSRLSDSTSDEALAEMAQSGDHLAFETLCNRYLSITYSRLCALLPPHAVEDVTQEVLIATLRGIKRYRGRSKFRTWVAGIIRNKVADYYRKQSRRPDTLPLDHEMTGNPTVRDKWEEHAQVRIALCRLPGHYQEIILLRFSEGLSFRQIAKALDISLEAAKSRYRRAVTALAQVMGTRDGQPEHSS